MDSWFSCDYAFVTILLYVQITHHVHGCNGIHYLITCYSKEYPRHTSIICHALASMIASDNISWGSHRTHTGISWNFSMIVPEQSWTVICAYPHHRRCTVKRLRPLSPNRTILEKWIHSGHKREKRRKEKNSKIAQCLTPMTCHREQTSWSHQGANPGWKSWCHGLGTTQTCHKETSGGIPEPKEIGPA